MTDEAIKTHVETKGAREALTMYRTRSDISLNEQAASFSEELTLDERIEMLFYMMMHTNALLSMIENAVAPGLKQTLASLDEDETKAN